MREKNNISVGWLDTSIHDFLRELVDWPTTMDYALITCLDSCTDMRLIAKTSKSVAPLRRGAKFIGNGLLVRTRRLIATNIESRIFFGFDEVWFFSHREIKRKPDSISIVGPDKLPKNTNGKLTNWMNDNRCSLGIGDGFGMNYCARLRGVASILVDATYDLTSQAND